MTETGVKSLGTALDIVEALYAGNTSVTDLAAACGCSKSTVHSHLTTLQDRGYVVKDDNGYHLGLRFLDLGNKARSRFNLYHQAKPEVDNLVAKIGERAQLMVEEHGMGSYIYQAQDERAITTDSHVGTRVYLHSTAVGKAYLAFLPEDQVDAILDIAGLPGLTDKTVTDRETLREELQEVKQTGVAFNDEERIDGMRAVGVPITDADGIAVAALSVSGPTTRMTDERFKTDLPTMLQQVCRIISIKTTYS